MYRLLEINESIMTEMEQIKRWKSNSIDIFVEPNVTVYKGLEAESYNKMVQFLALVLVAQILAFRAGLTSKKRWKYQVSDPNKTLSTYSAILTPISEEQSDINSDVADMRDTLGTLFMRRMNKSKLSTTDYKKQFKFTIIEDTADDLSFPTKVRQVWYFSKTHK